MDVKEIAAVLMKHVGAFVQPAIDALGKQINDGLRTLREEFDRRIAEIPSGKDGRDGADGKDGAPGADGAAGGIGEKGDQGDRGEAGAEGARGAQGEKGDAGERGPQGEPGMAGERGEKGADAVVTPEMIALQLNTELIVRALEAAPELIAKHIEAFARQNPAPAGRDGRDGLPGVQGEKGIDGVNGVDGKDGVDGLGLDDFDAEVAEDGRTVILRLARGERVVEKRLPFAIPLDRGVFKEGAEYEHGDCVTWGGSLFIAQRKTTDKPGTSDAWRLSVKRGRDGEAGPRGEKGEQGRSGDHAASHRGAR